jgi:hypothetical protein
MAGYLPVASARAQAWSASTMKSNLRGQYNWFDVMNDPAESQ